ncbi:Lrp/AsnC family transcriptional regulator [Salinigranum marinum]|uniref:Lrp/AsnC family transcriptional regulator n=1 Tax=Salinigranum marinum TaxID=1515595 RepID=UPI002989EAEF|nr:TrkA C-terminal domain-containing protein [Salinigranum marinum]
MTDRLDDIDKRILYHLTENARDISAPMIAETVDVTPATIRHRIQRLEQDDVIEGYHADVNYERTGERTKRQITCTASVEDRSRLGREIAPISGVVEVRELLSGRENLVVTVVSTDTDDLSRIERELSELGLDIETEHTIRDDITQPYGPFAPGQGQQSATLTDFQRLSGGAEVVEFAVTDSAPIAGETIEEASESGLLENVLVVGLERGDELLTPKGETTIAAGDVVTIFARTAIPDRTIRAFEGDEDRDAV